MTLTRENFWGLFDRSYLDKDYSKPSIDTILMAIILADNDTFEDK